MKTIDLREGFSLITAIVIMVLMATVAIFVMNLSGKIVKSTTQQYQRAQAELYAKSYTEFAVMAVTAHDRVADCVDAVNGSIGNINNGGYDINVSISYIGLATEISNCTRQLNVINVSTPSTPLTIIIDAYVSYKDPDNTVQTLTVHRRTVQKI